MKYNFALKIKYSYKKVFMNFNKNKINWFYLKINNNNQYLLYFIYIIYRESFVIELNIY